MVRRRGVAGAGRFYFDANTFLSFFVGFNFFLSTFPGFPPVFGLPVSSLQEAGMYVRVSVGSHVIF